jgi:hypothetical protein
VDEIVWSFINLRIHFVEAIIRHTLDALVTSRNIFGVKVVEIIEKLQMRLLRLRDPERAVDQRDVVEAREKHELARPDDGWGDAET